jgi:hypothetical protein
VKNLFGGTAFIREYAERFARRWKPYLSEDADMRADLHIGASGNMIAMEFYPVDAGDPWDLTPKKDSWAHVLEEIGGALPCTDDPAYSVTVNGIMVVKRGQKRFWTRGLAREDEDATLCMAMKIEIDMLNNKKSEAKDE